MLYRMVPQVLENYETRQRKALDMIIKLYTKMHTQERVSAMVLRGENDAIPHSHPVSLSAMASHGVSRWGSSMHGAFEMRARYSKANGTRQSLPHFWHLRHFKQAQEGIATNLVCPRDLIGF